MSALLGDVRVLAGTIGPRGTGTAGEAAAANYVADRLRGLGLEVERSTFRAVASQNAFAIAVNLVALLAVLLYPLGGSLTRWIAAGLALSTPLMLAQTIRTSSNPLGFLLPQVTSRNVVARLQPLGKVNQHAVILAHLDTNRCRPIWSSSAVRYLEPLTYLTFSLLLLLGIIYLAGALLGDASWIWWASLPLGCYAAGSIVTLVLDDRSPFSFGANDNAASVAVALEVGARLQSKVLQHTQVWLAFTGAEETDHAGLKTLLKAQDASLRQAVFFGLEGLGGGEVVYLTRQGTGFHYRPDSETLSLAEQVASREAHLEVAAAQMTMEDETGTLRRQGYRAICIAGMAPVTGSLPHWHRRDDTLDTISNAVMERAADFVEALVREFDRHT